MFDTHCHLDFEALKSDLDGVLSGAKKAGIAGLVVPGCFVEQWDSLLSLKEIPEVDVAVGLHPYFTTEETEVDFIVAEVEAAVSRVGAIAIGECGFDKNRGASLDQQQRLFEGHLELAIAADLPLIVHAVGAEERLFQSVKRLGIPRAGAVVHGFSGDAALGRALISRGFFLGIGCAVTRPHRKKLRQALTELPLEWLVLETDAPDQAPLGLDRPGRPEDLGRVAYEVAKLKELPQVTVQEVTEKSARRLFRVVSGST